MRRRGTFSRCRHRRRDRFRHRVKSAHASRGCDVGQLHRPQPPRLHGRIRQLFGAVRRVHQTGDDLGTRRDRRDASDDVGVEQRGVHDVGPPGAQELRTPSDETGATTAPGKRHDLHSRGLDRRDPDVVALVEVRDLELNSALLILRREHRERTFGAARDEAVDQVDDVHDCAIISARRSCHRRTDDSNPNSDSQRTRAARPNSRRRCASSASVRVARTSASPSSTGTTNPVTPSVTTSAAPGNRRRHHGQAGHPRLDQHARHALGRPAGEHEDVAGGEQRGHVGNQAEHFHSRGGRRRPHRVELAGRSRRARPRPQFPRPAAFASRSRNRSGRFEPSSWPTHTNRTGPAASSRDSPTRYAPGSRPFGITTTRADGTPSAIASSAAAPDTAATRVRPTLEHLMQPALRAVQAGVADADLVVDEPVTRHAREYGVLQRFSAVRDDDRGRQAVDGAAQGPRGARIESGPPQRAGRHVELLIGAQRRVRRAEQREGFVARAVAVEAARAAAVRTFARRGRCRSAARAKQGATPVKSGMRTPVDSPGPSECQFARGVRVGTIRRSRDLTSRARRCRFVP